ncbi:unnamed protein product, partial [Iphiclides podalirius]
MCRDALEVDSTAARLRVRRSAAPHAYILAVCECAALHTRRRAAPRPPYALPARPTIFHGLRLLILTCGPV